MRKKREVGVISNTNNKQIDHQQIVLIPEYKISPTYFGYNL
jgi:hypothetical protein